MSIPDHKLDEQGWPEWCYLHEFYKPCPHCADEAADRKHDEGKEKR